MKTKRLIITTFTSLILLFVSCQEVIFYDIRKEVALEDAQISGCVNSIVRYNDDIYLTNGNVWKKASTDVNNAHSWICIGKPSINADFTYVNKLVADENNLYAQIILINKDKDSGENEPKENQIWYYDGTEWKGPIEVNSETSFSSGKNYLFCTNTIDKSNRKAFIRCYDSDSSDYKVYNLSTTPSEITTLGSENLSTSPTTSTLSCAYLGGDIYFSNNYVMTTNESDDAATYIYASNGSDNLTYFSTSTPTDQKTIDLNCSTIYSLAYTKDYLLIGTADGLEQLPLTDCVPSAENSNNDFVSNADSTLSSYYEIHNLLVIDPSKTEDEASIYGTTIYSGSSSSTSATQENCGLWAYFASRSAWNRE